MKRNRTIGQSFEELLDELLESEDEEDEDDEEPSAVMLVDDDVELSEEWYAEAMTL